MAFNFDNYDKKAKARQEWEELVNRYGAEIAKVVRDTRRTTTPVIPPQKSPLTEKTYKVPSKGEL